MEKTNTPAEPIIETRLAGAGGGATFWSDRRLIGFASYVALLTLVFVVPLTALVRHALKEDLHSHILLIPVVSLYLAGLKRDSLPRERRGSTVFAVFFALAAAAVFFVPGLAGAGEWSHNDRLSQTTAAYVLLLVAGAFQFLGATWLRMLAFPFTFLVFMIPMPDAMIVGLEEFLMLRSAELSYLFFQWAGTPVFRTGQVLELPGIVLEVAQECSGIRSTVVLFITSLIAAYLFLSSSLHRGLLVALVIPLGIIRNASRVLTIGLLCVHMGPHMIDSWVHHRGGPLFFGASLVPLFLLATWFRYRENKAAGAKKDGDSSLQEGQHP